MALTSRGELAHELETLRQQAGRPSLRDIAAGSGCSHTTVSKLLSPDQPLPSWRHVEAVARFLGGNVEHIRELWLAAQPPATATLEQAAAPANGYRSVVSWTYCMEVGALLFASIAVLMFGTLASPESQWIIAVASQALLFTGATVAMVSARRRSDGEVRAMLRWLIVAGCMSSTVEYAELVLIVVPQYDHEVAIAGGLVYLVARMVLVMAVYTYLRRRSRSALGPWVRAAVNWTPLLWLVSFVVCFGLERMRSLPLETPFVAQLVLDATYFTLDIEFAVLSLVVLLRYTTHRQPFFLMLLLAATMWLSDLVWNLYGPGVAGVPFGIQMGYIVAGAAFLALGRHPEMRAVEGAGLRLGAVLPRGNDDDTAGKGADAPRPPGPDAERPPGTDGSRPPGPDGPRPPAAVRDRVGDRAGDRAGDRDRRPGRPSRA